MNLRTCHQTRRRAITGRARATSIVGLLCTMALASVGACTKKAPFPGAALVNPQGVVTLVPAEGQPYQVTTEMVFKPQGLLLEGDSVRTAPNSRVDLQFPTGLVMRLGPDSVVKLARGKVLSGEDFGDVLMDLEKGSLMTRKQKLSSESRVLVQTPTLIASVRGTEFLVKQSGNWGEVLVQEGTVVVDGNQGESATRDPNAPPTPVAPDSEEPAVTPENGTEVDEGNKIEIVDEADDTSEVEVTELDDEDRQELDEMSDGLDYMDAQGLEQIESIRQSFEAAKASIGEAVKEQRAKNQEMIQQERSRMQDDFEARKNEIRGEGGVKEAQGQAQSEMDRIKNMQ